MSKLYYRNATPIEKPDNPIECIDPGALWEYDPATDEISLVDDDDDTFFLVKNFSVTEFLAFFEPVEKPVEL
jgi:hypothetical protein